MQRARYKRYSEDVVNTILTNLESGQTIAYSCSEAGISQVSFNNWCKKYPDFNERVNKAIESYRSNCPEGLKVIAKNRLQQVLTEGVIIKRSNLIIHSVPIYENDVIVGHREKWREEHIEETNMGIPQWAIDRILPPPPKDIESAIKLIEAYGLKTIVANTEVFREWLIAQETNQNNSEGINRGLTESEANDIRAKILGIDANETL